MALLQLLLLAAVSFSTLVAAAQPVAECSLALVGHSISSNSSASFTPGVAHASLRCTGSSVTVAVNSTYLGQHVGNIEGVTVTSSSECQQQAAADTQIYPLLQFCGSYSMRLLQPLVQRVWLQNGSDAAADASGSWLAAVLAFGGGVNASIQSGWFVGNAAKYVLLVQDTARLSLEDTSITRSYGTAVAAVDNSTLLVSSSVVASNRASARAGGLYVSTSAYVSITDSIVSNNTGVRGPAMFITGSCTFSIARSLFTNHSSTYGAAVYLIGSVQLSVSHSTFRDNWSPQNGYGAAFVIWGSVTATISNSRFVANAGGFGAAIFMQAASLTVSDCEFADNAGFEGGVAHIKMQSQVRPGYAVLC
jgi:hypothetical protein